MKAIDIDVDGRTVWAESGLTAAELSQALDAHDLALGFGDTGSVGIGGITLGGGVGYLGRKYGLTIDALIAAEIVTADGALLQVDAEHEPDLFWAIRGGGGNFGVVTRFRYRRPRGRRRSSAGCSSCRPRRTPSPGSSPPPRRRPRSSSTIANVMPCPPMPFVPAEHHGKLVIFGHHRLRRRRRRPRNGRSHRSARWRRRSPTSSTRCRYPEIYPPEDPDYHPTAVSRTMFIDHVDGEVADADPRPARRVGRVDARRAAARARWRDGARARPMPRRTPIGPAGSWSTSRCSTTAPTTSRAARRGSTSSRGASTRATTAPTSTSSATRASSGSMPRIRARPGTGSPAIKARYDPTNLFHRNQNIPPSA